MLVNIFTHSVRKIQTFLRKMKLINLFISVGENLSITVNISVKNNKNSFRLLNSVDFIYF